MFLVLDEDLSLFQGSGSVCPGDILPVNMHVTYSIINGKKALWIHSFKIVQFNVNGNLCNMPINDDIMFLTHHYQKSFVLPNGGTAAKDSSEHDNSSCCNQDVGSKWICIGGQQTYVVTLIH